MTHKKYEDLRFFANNKYAKKAAGFRQLGEGLQCSARSEDREAAAKSCEASLPSPAHVYVTLVALILR
jgi:hypothetical protein